jgi:integrase/recombinase XerD
VNGDLYHPSMKIYRLHGASVTALIKDNNRMFRTGMSSDFRSLNGHASAHDSVHDAQSDEQSIRRRAKAAGIQTKIGNHTFRATGITAYLKNSGDLEIAQQIATHESSRTTGLYDRRDDDVNLDEVGRIGI